MKTVDILLASYNGSQYIRTQIFSIMAQTHSDWNLIIHDDGSTDDTTSIIREFCKMDSRIKFIDDDMCFKNPGQHFMYMLRFSKSPFVCFCDQDDIWLENKLENMIGAISNKDNTKAQVVFSNAYLFYTKTNSLQGVLLSACPKRLKELLFINGGIHGSASIFNEKMRQYLQINNSYVSMHDHLLTLIGCSFGEVSFMEDRLFLYRQHDSNVTGNIVSSKLKRILNAFIDNKHRYVLHRETADAVIAFQDQYKGYLSTKDINIIDSYVKVISSKPLARFIGVMTNGFSLGGSYVHLWIKILTRRFWA